MRDLRSPFAKGFTAEHADELAAVLKALANPARLTIISHLHIGARPNVELETLIGLDSASTASHVNVLARAGLVRSQPRSKCVRRELDHDALAAVAKLLTPGGRR